MELKHRFLTVKGLSQAAEACQTVNKWNWFSHCKVSGKFICDNSPKDKSAWLPWEKQFDLNTLNSPLNTLFTWWRRHKHMWSETSEASGEGGDGGAGSEEYRCFYITGKQTKPLGSWPMGLSDNSSYKPSGKKCIYARDTNCETANLL